MLRRLLAAFAILVVTTGFASAQTSTRVATMQDWSVYSYSGPDGRVCYAASQPTQMLPAGVNRDPSFFMVANWPNRNAANETNIIMGYPLEANSTVTVTINTGESFTFFTGQDAAWLRDIAQEGQLIAAMRAGLSMTVRGRSARGTDTTDTYSLRGVTAAIERAATECR